MASYFLPAPREVGVNSIGLEIGICLRSKRIRDQSPDGRQLCEPKMVPTYDVNPLKPLGVGFCCFMIISKNIKNVRLGVNLCLGFRFFYIVD